MKRRRPAPEVEVVAAVGHDTEAAPPDPRGVLLAPPGVDAELWAHEQGPPPTLGSITREATAAWRRAKTEARRAGRPAPDLRDLLPANVGYFGPRPDDD